MPKEVLKRLSQVEEIHLSRLRDRIEAVANYFGFKLDIEGVMQIMFVYEHDDTSPVETLSDGTIIFTPEDKTSNNGNSISALSPLELFSTLEEVIAGIKSCERGMATNGSFLQNKEQELKESLSALKKRFLEVFDADAGVGHPRSNNNLTFPYSLAPA